MNKLVAAGDDDLCAGDMKDTSIQSRNRGIPLRVKLYLTALTVFSAIGKLRWSLIVE